MGSIANRFAAIMATACDRLFLLAAYDRAPILARLHNHLLYRARRLLALYTAWKAGTLRPPRTRTPSVNLTPQLAPLAAPETDRPRPPRLPRGRAWLLRRDQRFAAENSHLAHLLADPEFQRFVREVPRAGRILRPILRLFSPDPPPLWLALPPRPRRPRPPKPRKPAWRPGAGLLPGDRPLEPYVLQAARAWKHRDE